jgi:hypothetical protein
MRTVLVVNARKSGSAQIEALRRQVAERFARVG